MNDISPRQSNGLRIFLLFLIIFVTAGFGATWAFKKQFLSEIGNIAQREIAKVDKSFEKSNTKSISATGEFKLPTGWKLARVVTGTIDSFVDATGTIQAKSESLLRFEVSGQIAEVLAEAGQTIEAGQPLARVDPTDLKLTLEKAQADLRQQQASYEELIAGPTQEEINSAKLQISSAQKSYEQVLSKVTNQDIAAARTRIEQAQAKLIRLKAGAEKVDRAAAEATLARAKSALESARSDLATTKEQARLAMEASANDLRNTQAEFSRTYWNIRETERQMGKDKISQTTKDQEETANRKLKTAEDTLEQKRMAYEDAKSKEFTTLQQRETDLKEAQAKLADVLKAPREEDIASAQADVLDAKIKLEQLTGNQRAKELAVSQANIEEAKASLAKLLAPVNAGKIAQAQATIARSELAIKEAQRNLDKTTLFAPFNGTISLVSMHVAEPAGADSSITLLDTRNFHIDVPVDELDIAQVKIGQQVAVSVDALPKQKITGKVTQIAPSADKGTQGSTTYAVTVELNPTEAQVRAGMTAVVEVLTQRKENILLVPRRAVTTEQGKQSVLIPSKALPDPKVKTKAGEPNSEKREIKTGLSNNESFEVVQGLKRGDQVLVRDVVTTVNPMNSGAGGSGRGK